MAPGGCATNPAAPGHSPESAHAGHARRRPVGHPTRGHHLVIATAAARESVNRPSFNVDRVSKSEGLDDLPADYSKLPPALPLDVPELGPPLPGDLGPAIVNSQQPTVACGPSHVPPMPCARKKLLQLRRYSFVRVIPGRPAPQQRNWRHRCLAVQHTCGSSRSPPGRLRWHESSDRLLAKWAEQKRNVLERYRSYRNQNSGSLQMPASPYQVMAGTVIQQLW